MSIVKDVFFCFIGIPIVVLFEIIYSNDLDKYVPKNIGYFIIKLCDSLIETIEKYRQ